ncbi:zinc phosphodiesterase ELAC protein 1-like isoform X2 [Clavelina lepadiformis]
MKLKCIRPGNMTKIFITHLHGDHMFGLPGLLCTISMAHKPPDGITLSDDLGSDGQATNNSKTIEIFGPVGLRRFIREALNLSRSALSFQYVVHELVPEKDQYNAAKSGDPSWDKWNPDHLATGPLHPSELGSGRNIFLDKAQQQWHVCMTDKITVIAGQLKHRIPSFGYVFIEGSKPGKLNSEKLIEAGVPKGPLFGRIKNGETVTLDDGRVLNPAHFIGRPQPGRKVAVLQDSCNSWFMKNMCYKCDMLIHEATNENSHQEQCVKNGHSTPGMAASFASATESRMLVLTHVSQRYKHHITHEVGDNDVTTDVLEKEAKDIFTGPVAIAYDGLVVNVMRKADP